MEVAVADTWESQAFCSRLDQRCPVWIDVDGDEMAKSHCIIVLFVNIRVPWHVLDMLAVLIDGLCDVGDGRTTTRGTQ